ncbi:DMT family transporter [Paenibacillus sp. y28]|uniref:DMT family transporter n=1 Tax=Paenibacillus sp. y28 TaxID=3129110 RepID=UPI00301B0956
MNITATKRVYAAAILYALMIGLSFLFVKLALEASHPIDTLAHRFTISLIAAAAALFLARRRIRIRWKELWGLVPLAVFYPALFFTFQTFGLVYTTSSEAGIIHATVPIFTMLLASLFLKERSTWLQKLFTLLSVTGVIFVFLLKGIQLEATSTIGVALVLISALSSAVYGVMARRLAQQYHLLDMTFIMSALGFVLFNGMSVVRHAAEGSLGHYFDPFASPSFIGSILYLGILGSLGSSLSSNYVLSQMEASKMSVFNNLATVITMAGGAIVLHEQLAYFHFLGGAMVIAGVIGVSFSGSKSPHRSLIRDSAPAAK